MELQLWVTAEQLTITQRPHSSWWAAADQLPQTPASAWHTAGSNPVLGKTHTAISAVSCTSYPLPSLFMCSLQAALSLCIQYSPVCLPSLCRTWVSSPPQQPHNPSQQSILFLTSQVPTHTQTKIPSRCSHINLKFLLPKPPTLLACCFSSSPNPPRLLYPLQWPLLPTFQTSLIFSAFLPLKHLLDVRSLSSTVPGTPRGRTSRSSCLLLQCPGLWS